MRVKRYDFGSLADVERLDNGFLRCPGRITRTGVFAYRNRDGSIRNELRLPTEVFDADSLRSFALSPLTNDHPPVNLDVGNTSKYQVGTVAEPSPDGRFVASTIQITDADAIAAVEAGKRELSCGYTAYLDFTPGVTEGIDGVPDGLRYDAIQREIRGNHVAIVDNGRAGAEASLRLDTDDAVCDADLSIDGDRDTTPGNLGGSRMKLTVDGITIDLDESPAQIVQKAIARRDNEIETMTNDAKSQAGDLAKEKARADKAAEDFESLEAKHTDATSPEAIRAAVNSRVDLERQAFAILGDKTDDGKDRKLDDMSDDEIRKAVIVKVSPKAADKLGDDAAYILARFDQAVDTFEENKGETDAGDGDETRNDALDRARAAANGAGRTDKVDAADARNRMIVDNFNRGRRNVGETATEA